MKKPEEVRELAPITMRAVHAVLGAADGELRCRLAIVDLLLRFETGELDLLPAIKRVGRRLAGYRTAQRRLGSAIDWLFAPIVSSAPLPTYREGWISRCVGCSVDLTRKGCDC